MSSENPDHLPPSTHETLGAFEKEDGEYVYIPEIDGPIVLDELPFSKDPWSPTPLDPHYLTTVDKLDYYDAALELMIDRFERRMAQTNLDDASKVRIRNEIQMFHQKRCLKNTEAMDRLRSAAVQNPELLTPQMLASIYRARSAQADLKDKLDVLTSFPVMGSISGIQATEPFNIPFMNAVASENRKNVIEELLKRGIDFKILNKDVEYKSPASSSISPASIAIDHEIESLSKAIAIFAQAKREAERQPFLIAEKPILEIHYNEQTVEMVEGMNPFIASSKMRLNNIPSNEVYIPGKGRVNLQNLSYMTVFRVVPSDSQLKGKILYVPSHKEDVNPSELVG
jgi:hypothetical protein